MGYTHFFCIVVLSYLMLGVIASAAIAGNVDPKAKSDWQCYKENWRLAIEVIFTWPKFL